MLLNCGAEEDSWVSLELKGDPTSPSYRKSVLGVHLKDCVEVETPIFWPPVAKSWLIWKDSDAGRDWGQEEKGMREDEMAGWHHWLDGHRFGWTPGIGDGQGGLACCGSWACKESDMTEQLNWTFPMNEWMVSALLLEIVWPHVEKFISGLFILFHWSVCLS